VLLSFKYPLSYITILIDDDDDDEDEDDDDEEESYHLGVAGNAEFHGIPTSTGTGHLGTVQRC